MASTFVDYESCFADPVTDAQPAREGQREVGRGAGGEPWRAGVPAVVHPRAPVDQRTAHPPGAHSGADFLRAAAGRVDGGPVQFSRLQSADRRGRKHRRPAFKTPEAPCVVVSAHLDTVLAPRSPGEIAVEPDGRLRGPGVADNGAGLAALLAVAAALDASPSLGDLHCGLLLLANVCEEGEGNLSGMRHFCEDSRLGADSRAFVVLDGPAVDHITCTALESRRFEVTYTGPGGHSWSDFGVGNPVHALSRAVTIFLDQQAENRSLRSSPEFVQFRVGGSGHQRQFDPRLRARQSRPALGEQRVGRGTLFSFVVFCRKGGRTGERRRHGWVCGRPASGHWFPSWRTAGRGRLHPAFSEGRGFPSGHPVPPGLRLHRRQHPSFQGTTGCFHRGRWTRRRRPHALRVVSTAGPGPRSEAGAPYDRPAYAKRCSRTGR